MAGRRSFIPVPVRRVGSPISPCPVVRTSPCPGTSRRTTRASGLRPPQVYGPSPRLVSCPRTSPQQYVSPQQASGLRPPRASGLRPLTPSCVRPPQVTGLRTTRPVSRWQPQVCPTRQRQVITQRAACPQRSRTPSPQTPRHRSPEVMRDAAIIRKAGREACDRLLAGASEEEARWRMAAQVAWGAPSNKERRAAEEARERAEQRQIRREMQRKDREEQRADYNIAMEAVEDVLMEERDMMLEAEEEALLNAASKKIDNWDQWQAAVRVARDWREKKLEAYRPYAAAEARYFAGSGPRAAKKDSYRKKMQVCPTLETVEESPPLVDISDEVPSRGLPRPMSPHRSISPVYERPPPPYDLPPQQNLLDDTLPQGLPEALLDKIYPPEESSPRHRRLTPTAPPESEVMTPAERRKSPPPAAEPTPRVLQFEEEGTEGEDDDDDGSDDDDVFYSPAHNFEASPMQRIATSPPRGVRLPMDATLPPGLEDMEAVD